MSKKEIAKKVLLTILIMVVVYICCFIETMIFSSSYIDVKYVLYTHLTCSITVGFLLILTIWRKEGITKTIASIMISCGILSFIVNTYYYKLSYIVEPKIYLKRKYEYSYNGMKIIETKRYHKEINWVFWATPKITPRSAKVVYGGKEIYVYYNTEIESWTDEPMEE